MSSLPLLPLPPPSVVKERMRLGREEATRLLEGGGGGGPPPPLPPAPLRGRARDPLLPGDQERGCGAGLAACPFKG